MLHATGTNAEFREAFVTSTSLATGQDRVQEEVRTQGKVSQSTALIAINKVESAIATSCNTLQQWSQYSASNAAAAAVLQGQSNTLVKIVHYIKTTQPVGAATSIGAPSVAAKQLMLTADSQFEEASLETTSLTQCLGGQANHVRMLVALSRPHCVWWVER
jgi:hypothetical protein